MSALHLLVDLHEEVPVHLTAISDLSAGQFVVPFDVRSKNVLVSLCRFLDEYATSRYFSLSTDAYADHLFMIDGAAHVRTSKKRAALSATALTGDSQDFFMLIVDFFQSPLS
jgi:hypothetical protein